MPQFLRHDPLHLSPSNPSAGELCPAHVGTSSTPFKIFLRKFLTPFCCPSFSPQSIRFAWTLFHSKAYKKDASYEAPFIFFLQFTLYHSNSGQKGQVLFFLFFSAFYISITHLFYAVLCIATADFQCYLQPRHVVNEP